ncbi:MAG: site-2 protease family protein [Cyclobacteriaceae bacterium]
MNSSWTIGRISGIVISIHWTFLILIAWIVFTNLQSGVDAISIVWSVAFVLSIFGCVILHELGHALTARRFNIGTKSITLYPIGGVASLESIPKKPKEELWVALAGPAVNVVIAIALSPLVNRELITQPETLQTIGPTNFLFAFVTVNLWLALFNLLPAFPMDGGRVLRALLAFKLSRYKATRIAAAIGQIMAILFVFAGFYVNPFLIFIGLFIFLGAQAEARQSQTEELAGDNTIGSITIRDFPTLPADGILQDAIDVILNSQNKNFIVQQNGNIIGTLSHRGIIQALGQRGTGVKVSDVMDRDFLTLQQDKRIDEALMELQQKKKTMAMVVSNNQFVGMIDTDNLVEFIMLQAAKKRFADQH